MHAEATDATLRRRALAARLSGLYALTPDVDDTESLAASVRAAIAGGARAVQYRHKRADAALRAAQARALAACCRDGGALFIVNDDPALAAAVGADGVHVGADDGDLASARALVGDGALVGVSCYDDLARAEAAVRAGADYVAFGSLYPSSVKPGARRAPLSLLARARALGVPVVAIGGIDATNAAQAVGAGADAVAVISAVFGTHDPAEARAAAARIAHAIAHAPPR